jgi:hypothetical protein
VRRLRRIVSNSLTVLSLFLFAATVALWVRSSRGGASYAFVPFGDGRRWELGTRDARLCLDDRAQHEIERHRVLRELVSRWENEMNSPARAIEEIFIPGGDQPGLGDWLRVAPTGDGKASRTDAEQLALLTKMLDSRPTVYSVHLAIPLAITSLLPIGALAAWMVRRSSRPKGLCARCGYDLRVTPDRCPECGTVPPGANPAAGRTG